MPLARHIYTHGLGQGPLHILPQLPVHFADCINVRWVGCNQGNAREEGGYYKISTMYIQVR